MSDITYSSDQPHRAMSIGPCAGGCSGQVWQRDEPVTCDRCLGTGPGGGDSETTPEPITYKHDAGAGKVVAKRRGGK